MLIHLMQHGTCMPKELDAHEPLSPMGREQIDKSGRAARILGLRFELIACSRKARAMQTAEIMAEHTGYPVPSIEISDTIKAMTPPRETVAFIKEYQGLDSILIVGHLPSLGLVASLLLSGGTKLDLHIENGGMTQINYNLTEERGILNWHLSPFHLSKIASD